ncbi:MAG TPA: hypothetical protein DET40_03220 [Lentisphaeria bacterium]|nr:MAG: hypothetical protein A2X45_22270 [Lentisphaerae bacterium GWF2_50_93]HCE42542.1 hypothetical protein [Lentisphaeria bacterium]
MKIRKTILCLALILATASMHAKPADPYAARGIFQTPITAADLDPAGFAEYVDGQEKKIEPSDARDKSANPQWLIWTQADGGGHSGRKFGESKKPGFRHLRIGFVEEKPVGSLMVSGDARVSVLKPGAAYPGNLADDSQWIPAERMTRDKITAEEPDKDGNLFIWNLPAGTKTRALRFTHEAQESDKTYNGNVGGVYVLSERFANIAPQAQAISRSSSEKAGRLINQNTDGFWGAWENMNSEGSRPKLINEDPEWMMLVWQRPVPLRGVSLEFPGFKAAELYIYKGAEATHPRDSADKDWEKLMDLNDLKCLYSMPLPVWFFDFGKVVTTRAIRLKVTEPLVDKEQHPHIKNKIMGGKRIWLGEFMALRALGTDALATALPVTTGKKVSQDLLIPVKFTLPEDGFVTLVIEDKDGKRIRNLISETPFPKGENVTYWDGTDDLGRDIEAAKHGLYHIPAQFVAPGEYRVRGLWRKEIHSYYEFGVYNPGTPPWSVADHTGGWLSNHCAPMAAAYVPAEKSPTKQPAMFLGCYLTEGPDGLAWVDLDGKKRGGKGWIGGNWTTAPYIAYDWGPKADPGVYLYVASMGRAESGETDKRKKKNNPIPELRITALTSGSDRPILKEELEMMPDGKTNVGDEIGGLAAYDGILVCSLTGTNQLLYVSALDTADKKPGRTIGSVKVDSPRGLVFDPKGRLLVISGKKVVEVERSAEVEEHRVIISEGLEDPAGITLDADGNIYISDRGNSHQVKVFSPQGKFLRAIGKAGTPKEGPYDPLHMNNPRGLAIDPNRHLWVAEDDFMPKRVSVWTLDGKLVNAFYGPSKYGGGGSIDPVDRTSFYYAEEGRGTMEFKLDWDKGTSQLLNVLSRRDPDDQKLPFRSAAPETVMYRDVGGRKLRYFTNCYNSNPTGGHGTAFIFMEENNVLRPVAGMGRGSDWKEMLKADEFIGLIPEGVINAKGEFKNTFFFMWSDLDADGKVQASELDMRLGSSGGVTVLPDFSFCLARFGLDKEPKKSLKLAPLEFTEKGIPKYDFSKAQVLAENVQGPASSGGDQVLVDDAGNVVATLGIAPFPQHSISGGKPGSATWSYPSMWPGLHASHEAPKPKFPGELIGTTRLMGSFINPKGSDAGPVFALNTSMGAMYFFTSDGLFIATPFVDNRISESIRSPVTKRNMSLDGLSLGGENFWPMIAQTEDGRIYLVNGNHSIFERIEGLETIRRIPQMTIDVTAKDLEKAQKHMMEVEAQRKLEQGSGLMFVSVNAPEPALDGKVDDWPSTGWVDIDKSGSSAWFNANSRPYDIKGSVLVANGKLYAAWQTGDAKLLRNSGEMPIAPFKTGGTLELMISANSAADPKRGEPVAGDIRLTVTQLKDPSDKKGLAVKTFAILYRPVVPGTKTDKVPFSSPWRTIYFDSVDDVSDKVQLATDGKGSYEISVPLEVLGLMPKPGMRIKGDIGILRGNGSETLARTYWSNKATSIISDVPSEAALTPGLWGIWEFSSK